jgi:hypothetical protein
LTTDRGVGPPQAMVDAQPFRSRQEVVTERLQMERRVLVHFLAGGPSHARVVEPPGEGAHRLEHDMSRSGERDGALGGGTEQRDTVVVEAIGGVERRDPYVGVER